METRLNPEQRIQQTIGMLVMQNAVLGGQVDAMTAEIKELQVMVEKLKPPEGEPSPAA